MHLFGRVFFPAGHNVEGWFSSNVTAATCDDDSAPDKALEQGGHHLPLAPRASCVTSEGHEGLDTRQPPYSYLGCKAQALPFYHHVGVT